MRRSRKLLVLAALTAALVLPTTTVGATTTVSATTAVGYQLSGTASPTLFPQVSFSGTAKAASKKESGTWSADVSQDLGAITGGTFRLKSKVRTYNGPILSGTFGPATGDCAKTTIPVHGVLAGGGSFDVTVTRVGSLVSGSCVLSSSTVLGSASLVFP
jgi:hypothetical protein